jgi:acyl phosphate:glycerol-3-phosphate acyltransferase
MLQVLLWTMVAFISGSIPFSVLIGKFVLRRDIRGFGDGNPGATNVARAGGKVWGGLAVLLDALKGAIPVGLAHWWLGIEGGWLVPIALAPLLGHAYSPFLGFRGGKAVATTFGIWTGLLLWQGPVVLGLLLLPAYYLIDVDGWAVLATLLGFLIFLIIFASSPVWLVVWLGNTALLAWKHREDLKLRPGMRVSKQ